MSKNNNNNKIITVGIDIGTESTKIVLGTAFSCEIVRSDAGLHTTPTAVSFQGKVRNIGETANQKKGSNNCIIQMNRLLLTTTTTLNSTTAASDDDDSEKEDVLKEFYTFDYYTTTNNNENELTTVVTVDYNGDHGKQFTAAAVLAMLLSNIQKSVMSTIQRMNNGSNDEVVKPSDVHYYLLSLPSSPAGNANTMTVHEQLLDAAFAAGLGEQTHIVESSMAYASAYQRKFPKVNNNDATAEATTKKTVMIIDMGHAQTSVSVIQFGGDDKPVEEEAGEDIATSYYKVLSSKSSSTLGAANVDVRLWYHFQSTLPKLSKVKPKSRAGQRLLQGTHKLKHLLSQLPEGSVTVENVGENDTDITLTATRTVLSELCQADAQKLTELIQSTLAEANVTAEQVNVVEVLGGGCRIPWVQDTIQQVMSSCETLSRSLEDTSAALGAALVGEVNREDFLVKVEPSDGADIRRQKLREEEMAMAALDREETAKADARNHMEAKVLELRSAKQGKHGPLLPIGELDDYLNEIDDWLFSEECDNAGLEEMKAKQVEMENETKELCADYYDAVQKEHEAKEKEMEEETKKAQAEANGGDGDEEDHDNRRLSKKRRMEIVMKNKEEANELFKDGNWRIAAARYTKALTHCAKFVDLSPDDVKEVTQLKVTLTLNLALAYTKMNNFDQALRVCNEAIALDDSSAKAYYRRASCFYEKKRWDDAKKDIIKAKKLTENDKAIAKLGERIDLQLKKQKQKEKKMASKMFG